MNERGDTVDSLEGFGRDPEIQEAMRGWLRRTIDQIEAALAVTETRVNKPSAYVL